MASSEPPAAHDLEALEKLLLSNASDSDLFQPSYYSPDVCYLNHGGFGGPPAVVQSHRSYIQALSCSQPMVFHRTLVPSYVSRSKAAICSLYNIPPSTFTFVPVTPGIFSSLLSVSLSPGDVVVMFDAAYHSVKDAVRLRCEELGATQVVLETPEDGDFDAIVRTFEAFLESHASGRLALESSGRIKLAIIDHISSKPSILFPISRLISLCHAHSIPTLIDGAHIPGSTVPFDYSSLPHPPTFYCMTFHKWFKAPAPCGGLVVSYPSILSSPYYSSVIDLTRLRSSGLGDDGLQTDHLTQGIYNESTRDYSAVATLPLCRRLIELELCRPASGGGCDGDGDGDGVSGLEQHVRSTASAGFLALRELLGGGVRPLGYAVAGGGGALAMPATDREKGTGVVQMMSFTLPRSILEGTLKEGGEDDDVDNDHEAATALRLAQVKARLTVRLWEEFKIEVPVFVFHGELCMRVSITNYVTDKDFTKLAEAIRTFCEKP